MFDDPNVSSFHGQRILNRAETNRPWEPKHPGVIFIDAATEERYVALREILEDAFRFAAYGKGEERHGHGGISWTDQRHFKITKTTGQGFPVGQAIKKLEEGYNMPEWDRTRAEYLGAMTYIASAIFAGDQGID